MISRIASVTIYVDDQRRAADFWQNLGFEVLTDNDMGNGFRRIEVAAPGSETSLSLYPKKLMHGAQPSTSIVFVCENLDYLWKEMKEKGIAFKQEPTLMQRGNFAVFLDDDGNEFVLKQEKS
ncbi:MAG: VOC family protein [Candidatus Aenigmarchaeota archaeon]|nr:VOC family protein [Candidatus Aenigmarchaeota archaeon]